MLYSDMGRVLLSIVDDTLGWHDPIGGIGTPEDVRRQYGESSYQRDRNAFYRSGRELFLIELGKWGLGRQDLVANVNFFSRVHAGADGVLAYAVGHSKPGAYVELRAEMDALVVLNTAPHPMNPAREYAPGPVELTVRRAEPVRDDDYCIGFRPENARAYANTAIYNCQLDAAGAFV
jgi:urea carboxylase-associated protein 2